MVGNCNSNSPLEKQPHITSHTCKSTYQHLLQIPLQLGWLSISLGNGCCPALIQEKLIFEVL